MSWHRVQRKNGPALYYDRRPECQPDDIARAILKVALLHSSIKVNACSKPAKLIPVGTVRVHGFTVEYFMEGKL